MDVAALLLSRIQSAFTISFHIIFPASTLGLVAWLACLEACTPITGKPVYRRLFDFWLKIYAIAFGLGVVSGSVMAFQFATNWSELSRRTGPIQEPVLGYESATAFALEASVFGVVMFGRKLQGGWLAQALGHWVFGRIVRRHVHARCHRGRPGAGAADAGQPLRRRGVTIDQGTSPESSLPFMVWGAGIVVLPVTVIYTLAVYRVFKGKFSLPITTEFQEQ